MNIFFEYIDKQLESSDRKNLFYTGEAGGLDFIGETQQIIEELKNTDTSGEEFLAGYAAERVLAKFCQANQYYSFDKNACENLKEIYSNLTREIKNLNGENNGEALKVLARKHNENMAGWLRRYNPFAEKIYPPGEPFIEPVPCSEYSAEIQLKILGISPDKLTGPILDIGCGSQGYLVNYLRENGSEAYGIDRFAPGWPYFEKAGWLEYPFGKQKWGTLISNLGFSNHFLHHHLRADGDFIGYARKYVEILDSLKTGGSFYYAPALPFIEIYLDPENYRAENYNTGIQNYQTARVIRLK